MTPTVDIRAMTALKQDGTAVIPASLVIVLKGSWICESYANRMRIVCESYANQSQYRLYLTYIPEKVSSALGCNRAGGELMTLSIQQMTRIDGE